MTRLAERALPWARMVLAAVWAVTLAEALSSAPFRTNSARAYVFAQVLTFAIACLEESSRPRFRIWAPFLPTLAVALPMFIGIMLDDEIAEFGRPDNLSVGATWGLVAGAWAAMFTHDVLSVGRCGRSIGRILLRFVESALPTCLFLFVGFLPWLLRPVKIPGPPASRESILFRAAWIAVTATLTVHLFSKRPVGGATEDSAPRL